MEVTDTLEKMHENGQKNAEGLSNNEMASLDVEKAMAGRELKGAIAEHHGLMHDIRPLLKSFAHVCFSFYVYIRRICIFLQKFIFLPN